MGSRLHIDLRSALLPPCDRREIRPTCLVFSAPAAHAYLRQMASCPCVDYLYFIARGDAAGTSQPTGLTRRAVGIARKESEQPAASVWPCDPNGPTPPAPPSNLGPVLRCTPEAHDTPDSVITSIGRLVPVVPALEITNVWHTNPESEYAIDDVPGNSSQKSSTDHAVLVEGVREDGVGSPVLLVRNSWGRG